MDLDAEAEPIASQILKTTVITVVFSSCHYFTSETNPSVNNIQHSLPDDTLQKVVIVKPKPKKSKTIYLTFDDGPNKGTQNVINIINKEKVNATLFIIGEHVYGSKSQSAVFDSIIKCKYVELANHSFTHAHNKFAKYYSVPDSVVADFKRCADSLGLTNNIVRTPGRNIWRTNSIVETDLENTKMAADSLQKNSYKVIGWDMEWKFDNHLKLLATDDEMLAAIDSAFAKNTTKLLNNLVLLAHDQAFANSADSAYLHNFIIKLKAKKEYDIEPISAYPALKN
jgi:peptidoglycan-N-acetylglucosamine deacetylase